MPHEVFISYAHGDRAVADLVCASLEQEGLRCWIAPRDVKAGTDWGGSIVAAIKASRVMVLVFSDRANASKHIPREIERAVNHEVPIVPFRIETVEPRGSLEYSLSSVHWLDAFTTPLDPHLRALGLTVRGLLGAMPAAQSEAPAPEPPLASRPKPAAPAAPLESRPRARARRRPPIALAALLFVAIAALAGALSRSPSHPPDLGFEPDGLVLMEVSLSQPMELDLEGLCSELEKGGALSSAAAIDVLPFDSQAQTAQVEGKRQQIRRITPRYFNTMGMSLVRGRVFIADDGAESGVVILNESAAGSLLKGQDPVGKSVSIFAGDRLSTARVVGVVGNVRQNAVDAVRPVIYVPLGRRPPDHTTIVARATGREARALQQMQDVTAQSFKTGGPVTISDYATMNDKLAAALPRSATDHALVVAAVAFLAGVLIAIAVHYTRQRGPKSQSPISIPNP